MPGSRALAFEAASVEARHGPSREVVTNSARLVPAIAGWSTPTLLERASSGAGKQSGFNSPLGRVDRLNQTPDVAVGEAAANMAPPGVAFDARRMVGDEGALKA